MSKSVEQFTQGFGSMMRATARIRSQVASFEGVDFTGLRLVSHLATNGPSRLSDLAEELLVDAAIITRQSHILVDGGFAERRINPSDARGTLLAITSAGEDLFKNHCDRRNEFFKEIFDGWSQDEIEQFSISVERFTKALNEKSTLALSKQRIKQEK